MKRVVGIFSRESELCYKFLTDFLRAEESISEVRSFIITNNNFQKFSEEVSCCNCAILYHSKNRGRLNITDVTDSLYDEEIKYLSEMLGKMNVIVVADDLHSSYSQMKENILKSQPLITEMADDIYLFSTADKNSQDLLNVNLQKISFNISKKVSRTNALVRRIPMMLIPNANQSFYSILIQWVMMWKGFILLLWNKVVVEPRQLIYDIKAQSVTMLRGFIQPVYDQLMRPIQRLYNGETRT